ncbi:MAG: LacI family DNA-binding transcriptional regulator [Nakamurella sp.]
MNDGVDVNDGAPGIARAATHARVPPRGAGPTLEQVGAHAGVSRATVSRVVNGSPTVGPAIRVRVAASIAELGYQPNRIARSLATRRTDTFALVASEPDVRVFGDPFFSGIVRGVMQVMNGAGLQVVVMMAQYAADLDRVERYVRSGAVDGVLLISEHATVDPLPAAMVAAGIPLVIGGRPMDPELQVAYVDNDNVDGGRLAAAHLLAAGRRVIGTLSGPQDMCAGVDRLAGFTLGLGPAFDPALVEVGDFTQEGGEAAAERLLDRRPDLDGLFAASDLMAMGALKALRRVGRAVPADVALVGFDDIDVARYAVPPLTTVRQSTLRQGRTMARLLLSRVRPELLADDDDAVGVLDLDRIVLPVELVVRESA